MCNTYLLWFCNASLRDWPKQTRSQASARGLIGSLESVPCCCAPQNKIFIQNLSLSTSYVQKKIYKKSFRIDTRGLFQGCIQYSILIGPTNKTIKVIYKGIYNETILLKLYNIFTFITRSSRDSGHSWLQFINDNY